MNRFKGLTYFIEAAGRIKSRVPSAKFVIVGRKLDTDPGYWDHLQQLTEQLGLKQDVVFTGFREDVPAILSALDVFVLASIEESCPVALLEAMAMKVPVVATDVGAVSEMVLHGRTGFVVPPREPRGYRRGGDDVPADAGRAGPADGAGRPAQGGDRIRRRHGGTAAEGSV